MRVDAAALRILLGGVNYRCVLTCRDGWSEESGERAADPVSYTHLTLPTSDLV